MSTEKTEARPAQPEAAPFAWSKYDATVSRYQKAATKEAQAAILAEDPAMVREGVRLMRKLERSGMPAYFQLTSRLQENSWFDKIRALRDVATTYRAVRDIYDAGKWVYQYFKAP